MSLQQKLFTQISTIKCPDYYIFLHALYDFLLHVCQLIFPKITDHSLQIFKMYSAARKIQKDKDSEPTEFELSVAQVIVVVFICNFIIFLCQI